MQWRDGKGGPAKQCVHVLWRHKASDKPERQPRLTVEQVAARWGQRGGVQQPGAYTDADSAPKTCCKITLALGKDGGLR